MMDGIKTEASEVRDDTNEIIIDLSKEFFSTVLKVNVMNNTMIKFADVEFWMKILKKHLIISFRHID